MKFPLIITAIVFSALVPAFAITDAEITPAALAGKTLTFTIATAGGGFADTGTWTGTFGSPTFTVKNVTGNTVNINTTHSTMLSGFTIVTLPEYIVGSGTTTIALYTSAGVGRYEMNFSPVGPAFQIGTFTIGAPVVDTAEISVRQGRTSLTDGSSKVQSFGGAKIGQTGSTLVYTIKNTGDSDLTGLSLAKTGTNKADFKATALGKTMLAAGKSTTFEVTFKPKAKGKRNAIIKVLSSDADEGTFDIKVTGEGTK